MNEIKVFSFGENDVRAVQVNGEPWWVLKDVCDALGLSNPSIVAQRLDEDEVIELAFGGHIINEF